MFVHMLLTNDAFNWGFMVDNMFSSAVLEGVRTTIVVTILAMIIGVALGIVIAVMRLSPNPVLSSVAWVYTWFFRAVRGWSCSSCSATSASCTSGTRSGCRSTSRSATCSASTSMAAIRHLRPNPCSPVSWPASSRCPCPRVRHGRDRAVISSIDPGQSEAAQALGMSRPLTMRRIVLPQAMRVIVPPTGNETIAMLKDTSLLAFVPVTNELFYQLQAVGNRTFQVFPMLVAACLWYLALTSVLMVGWAVLPRERCSRGVDPTVRARPPTVTGVTEAG